MTVTMDKPTIGDHPELMSFFDTEEDILDITKRLHESGVTHMWFWRDERGTHYAHYKKER